MCGGCKARSGKVKMGKETIRFGAGVRLDFALASQASSYFPTRAIESQQMSSKARRIRSNGQSVHAN